MAENMGESSIQTQPQEHGGNLDEAIRRFGGLPTDWIDLSTGINPFSYPLPEFPSSVVTDLPTDQLVRSAEQAASDYFTGSAACMATAGAQAGISLIASYLAETRAGACVKILSPTYNEYERCFRRTGQDVQLCSSADQLAGADIAVIVTPNNPDGRIIDARQIQSLSSEVGILISDESFADCLTDASLSAQACSGSDNVIILKSFGKFFGLAGLRLGFILCAETIASELRARAGPWAVSGPALYVACSAYRDTGWHQRTREMLVSRAEWLDAQATASGWTLVGGCPLFRLYQTDNAEDAQSHLASHHIWSRRFSYSSDWIRLGLPDDSQCRDVEAAFQALRS